MSEHRLNSETAHTGRRPTMKSRSPAVVALLSLVTCGIYWFFWIYITTAELAPIARKELGRELNPAIDVLLSILTFGLWGFYLEWRNADIVREILARHGRDREGKAMLILVMNLVALIIGITAFVAIAMLQEEYEVLRREFEAIAAKG